jgi:Predicted transcriptional regulator
METKDFLTDDNRLLGRKDAMAYLAMSKSTFHRKIKSGVVPMPKYIGTTPVWRLADLRNVYNSLSEVPELASSANSSSRSA